MTAYSAKTTVSTVKWLIRQTSNMVKKMETECKICGGNIAVPTDIIEGEILSCPDCGLEFEITEIGGNSIVIKAAEEVKEDWGE